MIKLKKKLLKSGNLLNFDTKKNEPSFLTPNARTAFNYLWLTFTKALIFWHFNLKYNIWFEYNISGYAINDMLSQLAPEIKPDGVFTKIDLG